MDSKPRRGRLRRWAALLAALVSRGGAWVRRAAAALRNRLGRRRVAFFVVKPGGPRGEARSARTARGPSDPRNRAAAQEERRCSCSSPSARARRLTVDHAHSEDGDASAAAALVPSEDTAPSNSSARQDLGGRSASASARRLPGDRAHGGVGNAGAAAALGPGEDAATSPGEHRKHGETGSSRGNTDRTNQQGRRQEGGESPRVATLGEKTGIDEKNEEHGIEDINGAKAHGEDAAAATPGADGVALGWYPGGEPTKTGDRSVGVAPGAANHRKHGDPEVDDEQDGETTSKHGDAAMAPEEDNLERGGGTIAGLKTTGAGEDTVTTRSSREYQQGCRQEGDEDEHDGENTGWTSKNSSAEEENPERGGGTIADPKTTRQAAGINGAADGRCSGGERAQNGDNCVTPGPAEQDAESSGHSKKPSPDEENQERGGTRIGSSTTTRRDSTRQAAGLTGAADGGCSRGDLSAAPGPANEESHEGPAVPLDALPGGSDVVLVQADLAAAPAGGSSSRGRPRRLVRRKKKHTADPLILPPDEEEEDAPQEENDNEIQLHQTYRDKSAICRKNYIYCLMCHLNNEEKELEKDHHKIVHHFKTMHKCGGIKCQKKGCLVRAKYKRDIGLHESVCHKMS